MLTVKFMKGIEDNPKINAIVLVKGQLKDTHHKSHEAYKNTLYEIQQEKAEARAKAEQLFQEDAYDFDERIDGQGIFNQFLDIPYGLELSMAVFLSIFFSSIPS